MDLISSEAGADVRVSVRGMRIATDVFLKPLSVTDIVCVGTAGIVTRAARSVLPERLTS